MIVIVRHGQTDLNVLKIYGGRIDVPLNEEGIKEANIVKEKLQDIKFDVVYSSPLKRAYDTARIITDKDIVVDDRIIERDNGELEGKYKKDVPKDIDFSSPNENRFGIENVNHVKARVKSFLTEIIEKHRNENVLVVTHAGVGLYLRTFLEGEPRDGNYLVYRLENCEIKVYTDEFLYERFSNIIRSD